jgi:hypothetical protein
MIPYTARIYRTEGAEDLHFGNFYICTMQMMQFGEEKIVCVGEIMQRHLSNC